MRQETKVSARKLVIGSAWMISWRFVNRILGMASMVILARFLVPADFGLVAMATTFATSIDALSQFGIYEALVRRQEDDNKLHDAAFTIKLLRAVFTGALVAATAPLAAYWFNDQRLTPILLVLGLITAASGADNIGMVEFRRTLEFRVQFFTLLLPRLLQIILTVSVAFAFHSYWALLVGLGANKLVFLVMTYVMHPYRPRLGFAGWRDLASFSVWSWAAGIARMVWDRLDAFVIGPALGPARLGAYLLGTETALLPVTELVSPVTGVLFPGFAAARNNGVSTIALAPLIATTLMIPMIPTALSISASSNCVIALLLGPKWSEAQQIIFIMAWACALQPFSYVSSSVLVANGYVNRDFTVMALAAFVKVPILLATVGTQDLTVISAGGIISIVVEVLLFLWHLHRVGKPLLSRLYGAWARLGIAGGVTGIALHATGIAWQTKMPAPLAAIQHSAVLGVVSFGTFGVVLLSAWWIAKCPEGPEEIAFRYIQHLFARSHPTVSASQTGKPSGDA